MENSSGSIELPSGFRFHPTDEELITKYLLLKSLNIEFVALAIGEADLTKLEPWDLPGMARMGEDEWYVFWKTERRYPAGQRTKRGTNSGYWKSTGKDKEIYRDKSLVGMRKTMVFYQGKAPKGVKSNWVMHEYRLDGIYSKSDWVISRVFHKNQSGKKTHISALPKPISRSQADFNPLPSSSAVENRHNLVYSDNPHPPLTPSYYPYFSDELEFTDYFFNNNNLISKYLIDDHDDGNDLLSSFKQDQLEAAAMVVEEEW